MDEPKKGGSRSLTAKQESFCQAAISAGSPYVYALADSLSGDVFYIGKGRGRRMFNHEAEARRGKAGAKCDKIRGVIATGGTVECRVMAVFATDREAYAAEKTFIAKYPNLTNITAGGGGIAGSAMFVNIAKDLLTRLKPYAQWLEGLCDEKLAMVSKVWGSPAACYEYMAGNLLENAGAT